RRQAVAEAFSDQKNLVFVWFRCTREDDVTRMNPRPFQGGNQTYSALATTAKSGSLPSFGVRSRSSISDQFAARRKYCWTSCPWPASSSACQIATALVGKHRFENVITSGAPVQRTRPSSR